LTHKIDEVDARLTNHIDSVETNLTQHIDAVGTDLADHRADTEAHHGVWRVKEE
jgi:cytochrome c556